MYMRLARLLVALLVAAVFFTGVQLPVAAEEIPGVETGTVEESTEVVTPEEVVPPEQREIVLDRKVRVESVGLEFSLNASWGTTEETFGFSRLEGIGPTVAGLQMLLGVWHMENRQPVMEFYGALVAHLTGRYQSFTKKREELDVQVGGLLAKRIDLAGVVTNSDGTVSVPAVYSYVVIDRTSGLESVSKTIINLVWPEEEDVYYNRYLKEILKTCTFYGPGFSLARDGSASFIGYTLKVPEGWEMDVENDEAKDIANKKQAFKLTVTNPIGEQPQTIKLRVILSDELVTTAAYSDKLKSYFAEKGAKDLKFDSVGKNRFRITFPYIFDGNKYVMAVYVSGQAGNILQTNSYIKVELFDELKDALDIIGGSILPPLFVSAEATAPAEGK
jgi:hypothetical protein